MQIDNAYDAFWFLNDHPNAVEGGPSDMRESNNPGFMRNIDIHYAKIDPETDSITGSDKDTKIQVWLETGPDQWYEDKDKYYGGVYVPTHDPKLDCGGDTFDEALITLANLVKKEYGDYERTV